MYQSLQHLAQDWACVGSVHLSFLCPLKLEPSGGQMPCIFSFLQRSLGQDLNVSGSRVDSGLSWRVQIDQCLKMLSAGCW